MSFEREKAMIRIVFVGLAAALLSSCLAAAAIGTAGAVVGTAASVTVKTAGAVAETAVDVVTPDGDDDEEKEKKPK
jgi:hypothetical protein